MGGTVNAKGGWEEEQVEMRQALRRTEERIKFGKGHVGLGCWEGRGRGEMDGEGNWEWNKRCGKGNDDWDEAKWLGR